jgi:galactokinase
MDQLSIAAGVEGHATLIDCHSLTVQPVPLPEGIDIIVQFIAHRTLAGSEYGDRVAACAAAEAIIGPLRLATVGDLGEIDDPLIARRARHVIEENQRVRDFAAALTTDLVAAGRLMLASHRSLGDLFGTSTPVMDAAVESLTAIPGVYGARMTGGGFGGCVVALARSGTVAGGWIVHPVSGATMIPVEGD